MVQRKKNSAFAIYNILKEYADEDHPISQSELAKKLETLYQIKLERRAIYSNIDMLKEMNIEISTWNDNNKGYYLSNRQFSEGEVTLLCNEIHASHFIPKDESNKLIKTLLETQPHSFRKEFHEQIFLDNKRKTACPEIIDNFRSVSAAINKQQKIAFDYMKYDDDLKLSKYNNEGKWIASPYYIVNDKERTYVIMLLERNNETFLRHLRIDHMKDIQLLDIPAQEKPKQLGQDAYQYADSALFMFNDKTIDVELRCKKNVISQMIDEFGMIPVYIKEGDSYRFTVSTTRRGILIFAQQYLDSVEIISPPDLRNEFREKLLRALQKYSQ